MSSASPAPSDPEPDAPTTDARGWPWGVGQTLVVLVLCVLVAGLIGWQLGDRDGQESFNDADAGFLADMIVHHNGAVALGFDYLPREHDAVVGHFAREIVSNQSAEMAIMNLLLADAGNPAIANDDVAMEWMGASVDAQTMPGLANDDDFATLRASSGIDADNVFTHLMIVHHAAGIAMADEVVERGENPRVRRLARTMARVQRQEIAEMNRRRLALGLTAIDAESAVGGTTGGSGGEHAGHGH